MLLCLVSLIRFDTLEQLGREILKKNPNVPEVRDKLSQLREDQNNIFNMWDQKYADLKDGHELQVRQNSLLL